MMSPRQLLALVRQHWAIENDCNWTFDMVLHEDDGAWCTQGRGALALGALRMIAHNLMQWLWKCHVRVRHERTATTPRPGRELHELILSGWIRLGLGLRARLWPAPSG
jgi:hypothetical protein